jgi:uncharacterized protein (UPF0332 family)
MTPEEARERLSAYWFELADEAMASARSEHRAGRNRFAINRCYYTCFYAASAVLLREDKTYTRDIALQRAVHEELIHSGRLSERFGGFYDHLLSSCRKADYEPLARVSPDDAAEAIRGAEEFVAEMKRLAAR